VTLLVGETPIVELTAEDARAVGANDLALYAAAAAQRLDAALKAERRRLQIQDVVFSVSLAVFITLLAFLALRLVGRFGGQLHETLLADRERVPALRLGAVEVASRRAVRGALRLGLRVGTRILQIVVLYVWLLFVLSLFGPTREYGARLTGSVLGPAGEMLGRAGGALPMLVVAGLLGLAVALVIRTLRLFFESIARGETKVRWISADLAAPMGVLLRGALIVLGVLFAAPLMTGEDTGALSRLGTAVLLTLPSPPSRCSPRSRWGSPPCSETGAKGRLSNFTLGFVMTSDVVVVVLLAVVLTLARPLIEPGAPLSFRSFRELGHECWAAWPWARRWACCWRPTCGSWVGRWCWCSSPWAW
jgi:hypothetical protein